MKQDREKGGKEERRETRNKKERETESVTYYQTAGLANTGKTNRVSSYLVLFELFHEIV